MQISWHFKTNPSLALALVFLYKIHVLIGLDFESVSFHAKMGIVHINSNILPAMMLGQLWLACCVLVVA